jgi:RNA polymerase sigma factor (TIGR02999 family)
MRDVLTDYARRRRAAKRGGGAKQIELSDDLAQAPANLDAVLALNEALDRLHEFAPRQAKVVEMRFFGGLSLEEIAVCLGVTSRTVKRDWSIAKAWLAGELYGDSLQV